VVAGYVAQLRDALDLVTASIGMLEQATTAVEQRLLC